MRVSKMNEPYFWQTLCADSEYPTFCMMWKVNFTKFLLTTRYLSLTDTRSTDDENPCKASSDFPAIFVASTPWAKASSHGTFPFGTVEVGAVNWNAYRSDENVTSFLTTQECHRWDLRGVSNYPTFLSQHFHRLICCYSEFTITGNSDGRCRTLSNNDKHRLNFLTNIISMED